MFVTMKKGTACWTLGSVIGMAGGTACPTFTLYFYFTKKEIKSTTRME
jgi:hypothetical protein